MNSLTVDRDPQRDALEQAIGAQYEIIRVLGRGGMGTVYLARERALERMVAIKVLPAHLTGDEASRERFRREARTAAQLTHPGIVPLHSFGEAEGMLYFVMGYVRGQSLGTRMTREGRLPPDDVRLIMAQLADALAYAHVKGVVHRDIKPDNVLLDAESGRAMLTDFGIAKASAHDATLTEAGAIVGSPHYMSPEQASGDRDLDGRSDLYSLGVMGFAMLAGRLPFEGTTLRQVVMQHVGQSPPPLQALVQNAPTDLVAAIMRCLAKEPAARWPDGATMRAALQQDDPEGADEGPAAQVRHGVLSMGSMLAADAVFAAVSWAEPSMRLSAASPWFAIPLGIAGALVALTSVSVAMARSQGASWRDMRREAVLPPRWWAWWYPDAWRSREDVALQQRLPPELQRLRTRMHWAYGFIGTALVGSTVLGRLVENVYEGTAGMVTDWVMLPLNVTGVGLLFWSILGARRWGMARGLTNGEAQEVAFGGTANARFWRKPRIAALLLPPRTALASPELGEPQGAAELMRAIAESARHLDEAGGMIGAESVAAAQLALASIERMDAEIATLSADAAPEDILALDQRIAALGVATDDSPSRGQLREVLTQQRELLSRLRRQLDEVVAQRTRLLDLLRTLWLQVATLRAERVRESGLAGDITGRIRAIVTELSAQLEVEDVLQRDTQVTPALP